eukprot:scaffold406_cov391-Prasinococcus_capsulatus_cf.AAC.16
MQNQVGGPAWMRLDHAIVVDPRSFASLELCESTGTSRLFPGVKIASCRVGDEYAVLPVPPPVKPCETTQLSPEDLAMYQLTRTGGSALYPGVIFTTAYHKGLDRWRIAVLPELPAPGTRFELTLQEIAMHEIRVFQGPQARGWLGTSRLYPSHQFMIETSTMGDRYFIQIQDCGAPTAIRS